jgi:uncharacterized membrane protein YqhA
MSKKLLTGALLLGVLGLTFAPVAFAQEPEQLPQWTSEEVLALITRITNWIFTFLIAVVVIMVLISAYLFVTAGGNPDQQAKARNMLIYALVGFAVGMIARGIIALVSAVIGRQVEWKW